uniref:Uncharacterized protein n=1 Tax=Hyaloperonospora arabidopsidis (strain Emoy2) TaxID=559515 RepID=M4BBT0_HYAAE
MAGIIIHHHRYSRSCSHTSPKQETEDQGGTEYQVGGVPERDFKRFEARVPEDTNALKDDIQ